MFSDLCINIIQRRQMIRFWNITLVPANIQCTITDTDSMQQQSRQFFSFGLLVYKHPKSNPFLFFVIWTNCGLTEMQYIFSTWTSYMKIESSAVTFTRNGKFRSEYMSVLNFDMRSDSRFVLWHTPQRTLPTVWSLNWDKIEK